MTSVTDPLPVRRPGKEGQVKGGKTLMYQMVGRNPYEGLVYDQRSPTAAS